MFFSLHSIWTSLMMMMMIWPNVTFFVSIIFTIQIWRCWWWWKKNLHISWRNIFHIFIIFHVCMLDSLFKLNKIGPKIRWPFVYVDDDVIFSFLQIVIQIFIITAQNFFYILFAFLFHTLFFIRKNQTTKSGKTDFFYYKFHFDSKLCCDTELAKTWPHLMYFFLKKVFFLCPWMWWLTIFCILTGIIFFCFNFQMETNFQKND